jgi:hypothetical protein
MAKLGDPVYYKGVNSNYGGHDDQPAIICGIVMADPLICNLMVFPDQGTIWTQTNCKVYENRATAQVALDNDVPYTCWPTAAEPQFS